MTKRYSAIVVGAGHNGLVAANYLAKAGYSVLILERRSFVGGACITEELFPGFSVSSCSYICHLLQDKVIEDLELRNNGLDIYPIDPICFSPFPGNQRILRWQDDNRTVEDIARICPGDGIRYKDWTSFWQKAAGILHRYFLSNPPTLIEVAESVSGTPDEIVLERMLTGNMKDLVEEYFENDLVQAAFIDAQDAGDPRAPGSIMAVAYIKCNLFTENKNFGIPRGGMGAITQAMARSARSNGVEIRTNAEVERISILNGKVTGVVLINGERIKGDVVISNADPKRTFLSLLESDEVSIPVIESVKRLKTNVSYLKFHCALRALPDFSNYFADDYNPEYLGYIRICPSVDYFEKSWQDARNGIPSSCPVMCIQIPTVYDPSMAPPGQHVMSVWVMYAPVRLQDGHWDNIKGEVGEHLIEMIASYAPNFRDLIIDWELFTPKDLEERVYLTDGNIRHLDITSEQVFAMRPNHLLSGYHTPIDGLYLCGAGTHPGGEVTGAPGHNASRAILRHLQLAR